MTAFGRYFAELRRTRTGLSLREFCAANGFDPGNLSKLERGKLSPPRARDKLETYARTLGLEEGSSEWFEFFDKAAASRGEIPEDVMQDPEVLDQLPVLFRSLRGERVPAEQLERLLEMLRKA